MAYHKQFLAVRRDVGKPCGHSTECDGTCLPRAQVANNHRHTVAPSRLPVFRLQYLIYVTLLWTFGNDGYSDKILARGHYGIADRQTVRDNFFDTGAGVECIQLVVAGDNAGTVKQV